MYDELPVQGQSWKWISGVSTYRKTVLFRGFRSLNRVVTTRQFLMFPELAFLPKQTLDKFDVLS